MPLTEAQKRKIREEETYRLSIKEELRKKKATKVLLIALISWFVVFAIIGFTIALSWGDASKKVDDFKRLSRERFQMIVASVPELKEIECVDGDCTSVAYFHFNKLPNDLEFMVKGNTKTFSNFKYKHIGGSHVTIYATYNGNVIYKCDASKDNPVECKTP